MYCCHNIVSILEGELGMTCVVGDSSHECLKIISLDKNTLCRKSMLQMTCFDNDSDLHDVKKGMCRVSKLVNNS